MRLRPREIVGGVCVSVQEKLCGGLGVSAQEKFGVRLRRREIVCGGMRLRPKENCVGGGPKENCVRGVRLRVWGGVRHRPREIVCGCVRSCSRVRVRVRDTRRALHPIFRISYSSYSTREEGRPTSRVARTAVPIPSYRTSGTKYTHQRTSKKTRQNTASHTCGAGSAPHLTTCTVASGARAMPRGR